MKLTQKVRERKKKIYLITKVNEKWAMPANLWRKILPYDRFASSASQRSS